MLTSFEAFLTCNFIYFTHCFFEIDIFYEILENIFFTVRI